MRVSCTFGVHHYVAVPRSVRLMSTRPDSRPYAARVLAEQAPGAVGKAVAEKALRARYNDVVAQKRARQDTRENKLDPAILEMERKYRPPVTSYNAGLDYWEHFHPSQRTTAAISPMRIYRSYAERASHRRGTYIRETA